ncbi:hypothetical protein B0H14DRAFT_3428246 [Mycena olivaceomarginata]|nr:hypothetical protein B0H14DRAFT_3428246 [Mycena olivaceomarginata]
MLDQVVDYHAPPPYLQVPYSSSGIKDSSTSLHTPRKKRISKVDPAAKSPELPDEMTDVDIVPPEPTERKIGDKYLPSKLSDHRRPYFAHDKAELELYATLTEGTLVLVVVSLATYVIRDQKTDSGVCGVSLPDKKIYHILIDRLRVLDRGDAEPWNPPVPEIPEARVYSPMTPQRRARDDTADTAFHAFGSKLSLSPPKRARRAGAGSS